MSHSSLESGDRQADGQKSAGKGDAQGEMGWENTDPHAHRPDW